MTRAIVIAFLACVLLAFGVASVLAIVDSPDTVTEEDLEDEGETGSGPVFLEDSESYPPGISKHLEKQGTLPPGLQKKLDGSTPPGKQKGEDWLPPGHARKGTLPPGLAKQGKTPPGWSDSSD